MISIRTLSAVFVAVALSIATVAASAEKWPARPIKVISPFTAGNAVIARSTGANVASDLHALAVWEKAVRLQAMLATRLRLSPQSRLDPKTVARRQPPLGPRPWE